MMLVLISFGKINAANNFSKIKEATGLSLSASQSFSFLSNPNVGDTFVLTIGIFPNTTHVTSITGGGVTWVKAASSNSQRDAEIWYGVNSTGNGKDMTINFSDGQGTAIWNMTEFSGIANVNPVDSFNSSNGILSIVGTSVSTHNANELIVGMERNATNAIFVSGPTNNFLSLKSGTPAMFNASYFVANTIGNYSASWTQGSMLPYESLMVAFKHN